MAQQINDSNFAELLANNSVMIVDFSATWCGPCRLIAPIMDELATLYADRALVAKIDIEEAVDTTEKYGIRSVPTVLFFKNGEVVDKTIGAVSKAQFIEKINSLL